MEVFLYVCRCLPGLHTEGSTFYVTAENTEWELRALLWVPISSLHMLIKRWRT
jgi:hypothetical protein